jgi:hypothetical protein
MQLAGVTAALYKLLPAKDTEVVEVLLAKGADVNLAGGD